MLLEIACFSLESAEAAANAGADRIEFCKNYSIGGKSPSLEDFIALRKKTSLPIYVMIRLRSGNFCYSSDEIEGMKQVLQQFSEQGADGFVFGCLKTNKTIDQEACAELINAAGGKPCTFHRAIDEVQNFEEGFETLISLGFSAVLTSGKNCTAELGFETLQRIQEKFRHKIEIVVGGGVRSTNIKQLLQSGCTSYHSAALDSEQHISTTEIKTLKTTLNDYEKN